MNDKSETLSPFDGNPSFATVLKAPRPAEGVCHLAGLFTTLGG